LPVLLEWARDASLGVDSGTRLHCCPCHREQRGRCYDRPFESQSVELRHVFFALRRSQQPELPPPPHYTLPVCRPAFRVDLCKHPLGPPQSVDNLWRDAGAHSVLEVEVWAARTGKYRRLLARHPSPPFAPAVAPTLSKTGTPAFSAAVVLITLVQ